MLSVYRVQKGVGLLEVLVALLLLSVAVLGFSAMQMQAIKATDETLMRSDAMVAVRNLSEELRLLPSVSQKESYRNAIRRAYDEHLVNDRAPAPPATDCGRTLCNPEQVMQYNVHKALSLAYDSQVKINAVDCPGVHASAELKKVCLIAAWGHTTPTVGREEEACLTDAAVYRSGATCFVMETY